MTVTYATNHAALWRALYEWLEVHASLPQNAVRRLNQVAVRPALPYATMQVIADVGGGVEAELSEYNAGTDSYDTVLYNPRRMTVQCTVYTSVGASENDQDAMQQLTQAIHALRTPGVKAAFKESGLAYLQQLASIQARDEQLGQRWERRATVDLEFGYTAYTTIVDETKSLLTVDPITEQSGNLTTQQEQ